MRLIPKVPALALTVASAFALIAGAPSVKEIMTSAVVPSSNVLFAVGGEVDPANGPDAAKTAPERWASASEAAVKLEAAATALLGPDQAKSGDEWAKDAHQLHDLAKAAEAAATAKDGAELAAAANALGDNCTACHSQYKPKTAG